MCDLAGTIPKLTRYYTTNEKAPVDENAIGRMAPC